MVGNVPPYRYVGALILHLLLLLQLLVCSAGHTGMSLQKLVENVVAIGEHAASKIPRKWTNIQMIGIKTPESVLLPIYNKTPEALAELAKLAGYQTKSTSSSDKKEGTKDEEKDTKRKLVDPAKSPLLRALKKQKQMEEEEKVDKAKNNSAVKKADEKAAEIAGEKAKGKIEGETSAEKKTPNKKKNKRKSSEADMKEPEEKSLKNKQGDSPASTIKGKPDDNNTPKHKEKKVKRKSGEGLEKDLSSATKQSETKSPAPAKESKSEPAKEAKDFILAKKFTGSKAGYVFRMGRQGLGYYVDAKPVVDKMAMEALKRSSQSQGSRGGGNKRRGRRSY
jgi:ribosome biogenesis protein UTP30